MRTERMPKMKRKRRQMKCGAVGALVETFVVGVPDGIVLTVGGSDWPWSPHRMIFVIQLCGDDMDPESAHL